MSFETKILKEPELEFGNKHHHQDPRLGLCVAGPLQPYLGEVIKIGVVGSAKTVESTLSYFERATAGFEGHSAKHPNMHPNFPGLGNQNPFRCKFEIQSGATATLSQSQIEKITKEPHHTKAVEMAVDAIFTQLEAISETGAAPDVALIALPVALIERVMNAKIETRNEEVKPDDAPKDVPNFRGMLKAKCMALNFPVQIVWEDVIDEKASIPQKIKESTSRKIQEPAGRTWNLFSTLYYKGSGKIPWRRMPKEDEYTACYIGVSFYREAGGSELFTSAAQMFDERGRGFILKGKRAKTESRGRHPYMTKEDAQELMAQALNAYYTHHRHYPARTIVLKTSRFKDEEAEGILEALAEVGTEYRDLVWVQESYTVKVLRDGNYPVLRGTFIDLGGKGLLYTSGSMPYYGTYPGAYDPHPLLLCPHKSCDSTILQIAEEVLSMTKINWNSTQMNQKLPIPIRAARNVGEVLKYLKDGQIVSADYRKYI